MTDVLGPTPAVDPRLRARRIAVLRDEGRRRLRRLAVVGGVVAAIASLWGVTRSPLLDVDRIRVDGARRSGADAVRAASGVDRGDPLSDVSLGEVERAVEALPWVKTAEARRAWPGTVELRVVERTAVATVAGARGRLLLVDAEGRVLGAAGADALRLVRIAGVPAVGRPGSGISDAALPLLRVARAVDANAALRRAVGAVVLRDGEVDLDLASGGVARLGPPAGDEQLAEQLLAVRTVLQEVDVAGLAVVDVRVPGSPVVTRG